MKIEILVVEDNPLMQKILISVLLRKLKEKYHSQTEVFIEAAENGEIAVAMCMQKKYTMIIMDINMPVMNGIDATKRIHAFETSNGQPKTSIVCCSTESVEEIHKAQTVGMEKKSISKNCTDEDISILFEYLSLIKNIKMVTQPLLKAPIQNEVSNNSEYKKEVNLFLTSAKALGIFAVTVVRSIELLPAAATVINACARIYPRLM